MPQPNEYLARFKGYLETSTRLMPVTRVRYVYEVQRFLQELELGDGSLNELTPLKLQEWLEMLVKAGGRFSTVQQKLAAVRRFFRFLDEFVELDQAVRLRRALDRLEVNAPRAPVRQPYELDDDQKGKLLDASAKHPGTGVRDRALIALLLDSGLRRFEVASLRLEDLDLRGRSAKIMGKGGKERWVFFTESCKTFLATWLELRADWGPEQDVATVFISADGKALSSQVVYRTVKWAAQKAKLRRDVWTHLLRHTALTGMLKNASLQDVQRFAGHSNPATTARYYQAAPEHLKRVYDQSRRKSQKIAKGGEKDGL